MSRLLTRKYIDVGSVEDMVETYTTIDFITNISFTINSRKKFYTRLINKSIDKFTRRNMSKTKLLNT